MDCISACAGPDAFLYPDNERSPICIRNHDPDILVVHQFRGLPKALIEIIGVKHHILCLFTDT